VLELPDHQGQWVIPADGVPEAKLDRPVNEAVLEKMAPLEYLAHQENRVLQGLQELKATVGRLERLDKTDPRAVRAAKAKLDLRDRVGRKVARETAALMVQREKLENRDQLVKTDPPELLVEMVYLASLESRVNKDQWVCPVCQVPRALREAKERRVIPACKAVWVLRGL